MDQPTTQRRKTMTRYTKEQIGQTNIRELNSRSKSAYALYVDQGEEHQPVLVGVD